MKRLFIIGVILLALAMAIPASGTTTTYSSSQRNTVDVISGSYLYYHTHIAGALHYDSNVTLPVAIGDLNRTRTKITWVWTGAVHQNSGYWNQRPFPAYNFTAGTVSENLVVANSNGLKYTSAYSHTNFSMNNTHWYADAYYYYDNITGINAPITTTETDVNTPNVGGHWTVNDTLTFATPPLPTGVTAYLKLSYPDGPGTPIIYPWNGTIVADGVYLWVHYQKYGPAYNLHSSDVTKGTNKVTVDLNSNDKLKDADWTIYFSDDCWDDGFSGITSPVTVSVNNVAMDSADVTLASDHLSLQNVDIKNDDNTIVFTWSAPTTGGGGGGTTAPTEQPLPTAFDWNKPIMSGVPTWAAVAIGIIVIFTIVAVASIEKK